MKRAVVFGAGSIGRGFVGASLGQAGWHVTFVDVVERLIRKLNTDGYYHQVIVSNDGEEVVPITPVSGVHAGDVVQVLRELREAQLVAVAVGAQNLQPVAAVLGQEAARRVVEGGRPLDVLMCENLHHAPDVMRRMIAAEVGAATASTVGLAATSIGRMVPVPIPDPDDPLSVRVEPYSFLPYDASALRCQPDVPDLVPVTGGFSFYEDRKLYIHNMGHCLLAFMSELRQYRYIWEGVGDVEIRYVVHNAMLEAAAALARKHDHPCGPLFDHVADLIARFANRALADTVERVSRDPERKMRPEDRILGSYLMCRDNGVTPLFVSVGVALGARRLAELENWGPGRASAFVEEHLFADGTGSEFAVLFRAQLDALGRGVGVSELLSQLEDFGRQRQVV